MGTESSSQEEDETAPQSAVRDDGEDKGSNEQGCSSGSDEEDCDRLIGDAYSEDAYSVDEDSGLKAECSVRERCTHDQPSSSEDTDRRVSPWGTSSVSKGKQRAVRQPDGEDDGTEEEDGANARKVYCWNRDEYWYGNIKLPDGFWLFLGRDKRIGYLQQPVIFSNNIRLDLSSPPSSWSPVGIVRRAIYHA